MKDEPEEKEEEEEEKEEEVVMVFQECRKLEEREIKKNDEVIKGDTIVRPQRKKK